MDGDWENICWSCTYQDGNFREFLVDGVWMVTWCYVLSTTHWVKEQNAASTCLEGEGWHSPNTCWWLPHFGGWQPTWLSRTNPEAPGVVADTRRSSIQGWNLQSVPTHRMAEVRRSIHRTLLRRELGGPWEDPQGMGQGEQQPPCQESQKYTPHRLT